MTDLIPKTIVTLWPFFLNFVHETVESEEYTGTANQISPNFQPMTVLSGSVPINPVVVHIYLHKASRTICSISQTCGYKRSASRRPTRLWFLRSGILSWSETTDWNFLLLCHTFIESLELSIGTIFMETAPFPFVLKLQ